MQQILGINHILLTKTVLPEKNKNKNNNNSANMKNLGAGLALARNFKN
jgi:hypothetical protein